MANEITVYGSDEIKERILTVRNQQVMIDRDLAELYGVETKRLNEQVKRNIERFPANFMFQLNENEKEELVAICDRFAALKHSSYNPYAFTEQGVAMLSAVLKSETAVKTSIMIMDAFVSMRHFLLANERIFVELDFLKKHFIETAIHQKESDKKIDELFTLMDKYRIEEKQGIFFQGQIFDAYAKFESFIQAAKNEIILIDAYIDLTVLEQFAKKKSGVTVKIYTDEKTRITNLDIQKFNSQYPALSLHFTSAMHDRFLIIDGSVLYHIGASLKDLGKKCFAFEILDSSLIPAVIASL
mgnify:CR=1 FL=1